MLCYVQRICVFMVAAAGMYAQTTAPNMPVTDTRTSGVVGISQGQTARFNVLRPNKTATAACSAVLTYFDGAGTQLKSSTVIVAPGTVGYLDLFSDTDLTIAVGQRKQIRVTVAVPVATSRPPSSSSARHGESGPGLQTHPDARNLRCSDRQSRRCARWIPPHRRRYGDTHLRGELTHNGDIWVMAVWLPWPDLLKTASRMRCARSLQFAVGLRAESIIRTSMGSLAGSSLRPSCSSIAVKIEGSSLGAGTALSGDGRT